MLNIMTIKEMTIKTTLRYHLTLVRMAIINKMHKTTNAGEGVGEKGILYTLLMRM
jgi:hypothetical protein